MLAHSPLVYKVISRNAPHPNTQSTTPLLAVCQEQGNMDKLPYGAVALCWVYVRKYASENVYHQLYMKTLADNIVLI